MINSAANMKREGKSW